jgi:hypothetical protein
VYSLRKCVGCRSESVSIRKRVDHEKNVSMMMRKCVDQKACRSRDMRVDGEKVCRWIESVSIVNKRVDGLKACRYIESVSGIRNRVDNGNAC